MDGRRRSPSACAWSRWWCGATAPSSGSRDGWTRGCSGRQDALDLRVVLSGWPAADLTRALAWDVDLQGPVTGDATLQGRRSAPLGVARFTSPSGRFSGVGYEALQVVATLRGSVTEVTAGSATVAGGRVEFRGTATDDGTYDGEATARGVDVAALAASAGIATAWRGQLSGHAPSASAAWSARGSPRASKARTSRWPARAWGRWSRTSTAPATARCW